MATMNNRVQATNRTPAVIAALGMTMLIGLAILALGWNALSNHNVVTVEAASVISAEPSPDQAALDQLQSLVNQYQSREQQYQQELAQAAQELDQTNAQLEQYQNLIIALQNAGVIRIDRSGQVMIARGAGSHDD